MMDNKLLKQFYNDAHTRDVLYNYIVSIYSKVAVERTFTRKPVDGLADAKEVLDRAFSELKKEFGEKSENKEEAPR